ncbi:ABC transporter permease [Granulicella sp. dw_53]|uniref:ABC transporter permease n=1 Tax=Granulicella sp. dw_53 TaxID=2719792 RepID=UPI001BD33520|nr:ABC transporter permease [Granulicella sp. dw_53]
MGRIIQDVRYALRQLRKAPGFTLTAILTLALGIGANAAIFTLVHAVLLRNLPVVDPKALVRVGDTDDCCDIEGTPDHNDYSLFSYDLYLHLKANAPEFEQLAAVQAGLGNGSLTTRISKPGALSKALSGEYVSGNFFQTLGLQPLIGRLIQPSDDVHGAPMVAVMSYRTWQREYAQDPSVVGSTFALNTHSVTIIGVTPSGFYGDRMTDVPPDFYLPINLEPVMGQSSILHQQNLNWVYVIGRIKPGTQLGPLQARMSGNLRQFLSTLDLYKKADQQKNLTESHLVLSPGGAGIENMQQSYASGLKLLMAISALVLLIACANIANLVLVRGMARRAETSVRMALGAQRRRVIQQMLTESVVLSCLGGIAGLVVAYMGTRTLLALAFPNSPNLPITPDPSPVVMGFAFGLSLLTGLVFGVAPAWVTSHSEPAEALGGSNRSTRDHSSLLQRSLVVLQAALSLVLLVGAGLLSKSLNKLEHQHFGLQTKNRVIIHISPENAGYKVGQLQALYDQIEQRFHALPGVERVALSLYTPMESGSWGEAVAIQGRPEAGPNVSVGSMFVRVGPEFFDIVGQHVLRGRGITAQDTAASPPIAVVNQAFVKKFFTNGEDPLRKHFGTFGVKSSNDFEIVGVVNDAKYDNTRRPSRAMHFRPLLQPTPTFDPGDGRSLYAGAIMLQTKGQIEGLESQARKILASIDPNLPVVNFTTFDDQIAGQFGQERLIARLTLIFGVLALALASIGLYGVTAYTVAHRTSEIGIRMALGAARGSVVGMVLREAMLQAGLGLAIGIPVALLCARFVKSRLYGVESHDLSILTFAIFTLAVSACVAGWIPARRAASTDPMNALRTE